MINFESWLTPDPWRHGCVCGHHEEEYPGSRARHASYHLDWAQGVTIPIELAVQERLALVTGNSPGPARTCGYRLARLMQRENHYDFPLLPDPRTWKTYSSYPRAYVAIEGRHGIGLAVIGRTRKWGHSTDRQSGCVYFTEHTEIVALAAIFVCGNYRRQGVARRFLSSVAYQEGCALWEIAWSVPFSTAGLRLAEAVAREGQTDIRICGGVSWDWPSEG